MGGKSPADPLPAILPGPAAGRTGPGKSSSKPVGAVRYRPIREEAA
jgi:hypothetical protein